MTSVANKKKLIALSGGLSLSKPVVETQEKTAFLRFDYAQRDAKGLP